VAAQARPRTGGAIDKVGRRLAAHGKQMSGTVQTSSLLAMSLLASSSSLGHEREQSAASWGATCLARTAKSDETVTGPTQEWA
jgi:hypothetical protein